MSNPLVAQPQDSTKSYSGVSLLESANDLKSAIESGDWASVAMGAVGTALDALSMAMDPFGAILAAGVGWLMEHVGPLKEALNGLTGNADEIAAQSETWKNVATELGSIGEDLTSAVKQDTASWTGNTADSYRQRAADTVALLGSAQKGCDGASSGVKTAGEVVGAVRTLVRDTIAELVGHLISWALQVLFTLGIGMVWVVPQVVGAVAKTASKIADVTKRLVTALKALIPLLKKAGDLFSDAAKAMRGIKPGKVTPTPNKAHISGGPKDSGAPKGAGGDETPSGAQGGGGGGTPKGDPGKNEPSGTGGDMTPSSAPPTPQPKPHDPPADGGGTPKSGPKEPDPDPGGDVTPSGAKDNPAADDTPPPHNSDDARKNGVESDNRVCETDPVDVASGEMVLEQTDVSFENPLELVLERTHVSSYRAGRLFGASWASTVDQRLEIDDEHARYFSPDGMILFYPRAEPGQAVLPLEGPRWYLRREHTGEYTLTAGALRRTLTFGAVEGTKSRRGLEILPLRAIEGGEGRRIDVDHDADGRPTVWRHSDGYRVDLTVEGGRVRALTVVDPAGELRVPVTSYGYDDRGRLTSVANSSGRPMQFDYDLDGRITGWQDRTGAWYRYVYDEAGRCVRTVGDSGYLDGAFSYEDRVTRYTDSLGNTKTFELNDLYQVVRETDALGNTTEYTHDRYDRLLSRTDPLGRTTSYRYDGLGRLAGITRPDGSVLDVEAAPGVPLTIAVSEGDRVYTREYSGEAGVDVPDPAQAQLGVAEEYRYESLDAGESEVDGPGEVRDLFGRPRVHTDVFGGQVRFEWTVEGLRAARIGRTGEREQWRYDGEGNEVEHVGPLGEVDRSEYGPFGLRIASVDATGARTTYGYDTELRLTSVTNPNGLTWSYTYDAAGRLIQESDFDGRVLRFTYDAAGQLVRTVNGAGDAIDYRHDALGNVVERHTAAGITTYAHDPVGRLVRATAPGTELEFEYDATGNLLRETVDGRTVRFGYDEAGSLIRRRTPSGVDSVWTYDVRSRPESLVFAGHTVQFRHDAAGRETQRSTDGAVSLAQTYDSDDRLTGQTVTTPAGVVQQRRFDYRPDGTVAAITDALSGVTRYGHDRAGRVVEVAAADHRESYRYDAAGNLVEAGVDGTWPLDAETGTRAYSANSLTNAGVVGYTYDPQGRLVARHLIDPAAGARTWHYGWDPLDRLTGVTTPDGTRWQYRYDPIGRRSAKLRLAPDGSVAERVDYTWAGTELIEQVHTGPAGPQVLTWERHPADERPVAQAEQAGQRFHTVVTDQIGTPAELVDASGLAWHGRAGLWGRVLPGGGPADTPLRFPGQYADNETGLHYNVYRYYDPATGRYLSKDPLGLAPAPDPAAYVPNPLVATDPLGLANKRKTSPCCASGGGSSTGSQTPGGGIDPGKTKKPRGQYPPRPLKAGGAKDGTGKWQFTKDSPYNVRGNSPKDGHLTDVVDLNHAAEIKVKTDPKTGEVYHGNDLSDDLVKKLEDHDTPGHPDYMPADTKWIKGHLMNGELGGSGEAHNLTPLTTKANTNHYDNVEGPIKKFLERQHGSAMGGMEKMGISYEVKPSAEFKFPNSDNPFERSIRDHVEIHAEYTGVTPEMLAKLQSKNPPLGELPPPGTKMDTITGKFTTPDGQPWTPSKSGHDFAGMLAKQGSGSTGR